MAISGSWSMTLSSRPAQIRPTSCGPFVELNAPGGPIQFLAPVAYQIIDGRRRPVSASYSVADETVRFALGEYDHSETLVIDPILSYFSYLGGTGADFLGNANPGSVGSAGPEPTQGVGV